MLLIWLNKLQTTINTSVESELQIFSQKTNHVEKDYMYLWNIYASKSVIGYVKERISVIKVIIMQNHA
jgi:hypothetical protein